MPAFIQKHGVDLNTDIILQVSYDGAQVLKGKHTADTSNTFSVFRSLILKECMTSLCRSTTLLRGLAFCSQAQLHMQSSELSASHA